MDYHDKNQPLKFDKIQQYVEQRCKKYDIDSSHGTTHALRVVELALYFIKNDSLEEDEAYVCILASMLHDTIDKKYMKEDEAANEVEIWLRENKLNPDIISATMKIITNMSYSTCLKKKQRGLKPYPDDLGRFITAYHIVRHSDLIDAYDPQRCYDYVLSKLTSEYPTDESQKQQVYYTFTNRIFRYLSDGWIFRPDAVEISKRRHSDAIEWFKSNFGFRYSDIVYY
jgi:HD superfamily phosphodiesterase